MILRVLLIFNVKIAA